MDIRRLRLGQWRTRFVMDDRHRRLERTRRAIRSRRLGAMGHQRALDDRSVDELVGNRWLPG